MKYNYDSTYIMYDGSSHYGIFGCDVEDDIEENDSEVVAGPFDDWDDEVDKKIEDLNRQMEQKYKY